MRAFSPAALCVAALLSACATASLEEQLSEALDPEAWAALTPEQKRAQVRAGSQTLVGMSSREKREMLTELRRSRQAEHERSAALGAMPPRERELIKLIDAARAADVDQVSAEFTTCTQEEARERDRPALAADEVAEQAIAACFPKFEWFVRGRAMSVAALATGPSADDLESYADSVVEEQRAKFRNQLVQEVTASRAATGKK